MWGIPFDPRLEMRGYPGFMNNLLTPHVETWGYSNYSDLVDNRIQINLPIHRWGNTIYPHNPLSVSTDYSYLKTDESVRSMYRMSILRGVKTLVFSFKKIRLALEQSK
jgi:hypothetical protein